MAQSSLEEAGEPEASSQATVSTSARDNLLAGCLLSRCLCAGRLGALEMAQSSPEQAGEPEASSQATVSTSAAAPAASKPPAKPRAPRAAGRGAAGRGSGR